jgi:hypothetical protein
MGTERENWDNEWAGLEPKQPRSNGWGCQLGLVLLILLLLAICGAGGYLAWQQFDLQLGPGLVLVPPTALSSEPETAEAETPQPPAAESAALAPTVTLPAEQAAGSVEVGQMAATPLIDGNLDEWAGLPSFESQYLVYSVNGWDGKDDVTATWHLGWDSSHLFVAVQVEDNMHVQTQSGNQIFKGDSVSIQIDSDLEGDFGPELSPDDYQVNLSPGDFASIPPSTFRFQGTSNGGAVDAPGHGIVVAAQQTGQGYNLEAAIPWRDIGLTAAESLVIGAAFNVNDNDTPGTAVQEVMKSHIATRAFRDPTSWGSLTLR